MATINPDAARYSTVAIILHWAISALIIANFVIVFMAEDLAKPEKMMWMGWHKSFGISILLLAVLRIIWRLVNPVPPLNPEHKAWERTLARTIHSLFYILLIAIPVAGWLMVSGYGSPAASVLGIAVPELPVSDPKAVGGVAHELHEILAFAMLGLLVLHVAGALKHHFIDRDNTLARMLPFLRRG